MRKTIVIAVAVGAMALSAGFGLVACSGSGPASTSASRPAPESLADGLTVFTSKPDWGVNAAFKENGRVVYFESRVGPLKPAIYREQFPNEPAHEMDERFVDSHGGTFIIQMGGDTFIDPTWPADIAASVTHPADRDLDFQLARTATKALATQLGPTYADHVFHATNLTRRIPSEMPELQAKVSTIRATLPKEAAYNASCYYNWWEGDLYSKTIYFIAKHSSNIGWNYSNCTSSWDEEVVSCNHGTCATDSSMSYQCYSNPSEGWVPNNQDVQSLTYEFTTSTGSTTGACGTGYNWDTPPGHDCNDDSAYFLNQVKSASQNTPNGAAWSFSWTDSNGNWFACNPSSGNPNDWSQPACP